MGRLSGSRPGVLRSAGMNLGTQVIVYAAAFAAVPIIVQKLGVEHFGLLAIFWMLAGYVPFLDLGLGQAVQKFVSEADGKGDHAKTIRIIQYAFRNSLYVAGVATLCGAVAWFLGADGLLGLPERLRSDGQWTILAVVAAIPFVLLYNTARAVPIAFRRFEVANVLHGTLGVSQWVGTILLIVAGGSFHDTLMLTVAIRVLWAGAAVVLARAMLPTAFAEVTSDDVLVEDGIMRFGGWMFLAQFIGPLIILAERGIITNIGTVKAAAVFAAPFDSLTRLLAVAASFSTSLLPFLSSRWDSHNPSEEAGDMYRRMAKAVVVIFLPLCAILAGGATTIVSRWLEGDLASNVIPVWTILAVGLFFSALAQIPYVALLATGHPKKIALLLVVEFPIALATCALLTGQFGPLGAAASWTARVFGELVVLLFLVRQVDVGRVLHLPWKSFAVLSLISTVIAVAVYTTQRDLAGSSLVVIIGMSFYGLVVWKYVLTEVERTKVHEFLPRGLSSYLRVK